MVSVLFKLSYNATFIKLRWSFSSFGSSKHLHTTFVSQSIINGYLPTCKIKVQDTKKEDINVDETLQHLVISCTFMVAKQVARYFFISTSVPGSSLRDRCVRCLKALVSTMFRLAELWFSADDGEESCSKNLNKEIIQLLQVFCLR